MGLLTMNNFSEPGVMTYPQSLDKNSLAAHFPNPQNLAEIPESQAPCTNHNKGGQSGDGEAGVSAAVKQSWGSGAMLRNQSHPFCQQALTPSVIRCLIDRWGP